MTAEAFPLSWPEGWPRTPPGRRESGNHFKGGDTYEWVNNQRVYRGRKTVTFDRARKLLSDELVRLRATNIVLSTNIPLRLDGNPRASFARVDDPGVAVYFTYKKRQVVMACDRFDAPAANVRSLGLAIEAMRQLERHGGGTMMERAFSGFAAIAPPDWKKPWRQVFGVTPDWRGDITALFREKAKARHSDAGGDDRLMAELNVAYAEAKSELGVG